ncbi:hypothetical protein LEMLEM_LOCUS44 [Lemmus lemmus]
MLWSLGGPHASEGCRMLVCSMSERLADTTRFHSTQKKTQKEMCARQTTSK